MVYKILQEKLREQKKMAVSNKAEFDYTHTTCKLVVKLNGVKQPNSKLL